MKKLFLLALLALAACDHPCDANCTAVADAIYCKPQVVSTMPTGITLYRLDHRCSKVTGYYDIFFASTGTHTSVPMGKASRSFDIPSGEPSYEP